jgi:hypothetical protein
MPRHQTEKANFAGTVTAVKARIRLLRSFDQISHAYQGYTLVLDGTLDGVVAVPDELRVAVGPKIHEKHRFRIGDQLTGLAVPVPHPREEWATHYKVSGLRSLGRGPTEQDVPAHPDGGIAPPLPEYRARGHRRLDSRTYSRNCQRCPFGLVMATEITIDQWNPQKKQWRFETHCYGPRDCPRYRPGQPHTVQGRKPWMVWVDDDVEREAEELGFAARLGGKPHLRE